MLRTLNASWPRLTYSHGIGRLAVSGPVRNLGLWGGKLKAGPPTEKGQVCGGKSLHHSFIQATLVEWYYVSSTVPWIGL